MKAMTEMKNELELRIDQQVGLLNWNFDELNRQLDEQLRGVGTYARLESDRFALCYPARLYDHRHYRHVDRRSRKQFHNGDHRLRYLWDRHFQHGADSLLDGRQHAGRQPERRPVHRDDAWLFGNAGGAVADRFCRQA